MESQIIAYRLLECVSPAGMKINVSISLTAPKEDQESGDWSCSFVIDGINNSYSRNVMGADSVQCLLLSIKMLRAKLEYHQKCGYRFTWLGNEAFL